MLAIEIALPFLEGSIFDALFLGAVHFVLCFSSPFHGELKVDLNLYCDRELRAT